MPKHQLTMFAASTIVVLAMGIATRFEGLMLHTYADPTGVPTVCYGSRAQVATGVRMTKSDCMNKLRDDMTTALGAVESCQGTQLPESVAAAFTSAVYNMGSRVACASTAATLLKQKKYEAACNQLELWNKARVGGSLRVMRGLTARRAAEAALCLRDIGVKNAHREV